MPTSQRVLGCLLAVAVVLSGGCAAQKAFHTAEEEGRRENWDRAVLSYSKAVALDPGNTRYNVALTARS